MASKVSVLDAKQLGKQKIWRDAKFIRAAGRISFDPISGHHADRFVVASPVAGVFMVRSRDLAKAMSPIENALVAGTATAGERAMFRTSGEIKVQACAAAGALAAKRAGAERRRRERLFEKRVTTAVAEAMRSDIDVEPIIRRVLDEATVQEVTSS